MRRVTAGEGVRGQICCDVCYFLAPWSISPIGSSKLRVHGGTVELSFIDLSSLPGTIWYAYGVR